MDAIILAGGYATRLYPITLNMSKPLLRVAGRAIVDYVLDRLEEIGEVRHAYVVTNEKFYRDYLDWLKERRWPFPVVPVNDGTTCNGDRLGAVGDILYALQFGGIADDVIVIGGDNLFDFSLRPLVALHRARKRPALGCYDVRRLDLVKLYSEARLEDSQVAEFAEKPADPKTTLIGILCYLLRRCDIPLVGRYLEEGNDSDKAGSFIQWLITQEEVVGYPFTGRWVDIGTRAELERAEALWSVMPAREMTGT